MGFGFRQLGHTKRRVRGGPWSLSNIARMGILLAHIYHVGLLGRWALDRAAIRRRRYAGVMNLRIGVLATCIACGACSGQSQGGLVNVPASNRTWTADDRGHDAIANGTESCPKSGKAKDDPIPDRTPKCPENGAAPPPPPPPKGQSKTKPQ